METKRLFMFLTILYATIVLLIGFGQCIAIAPSTLGRTVANVGKLSNTLKETTAWKTFTSHPNSLARIFPAGAMQVVQQVVRSFRKESEVVITTPLGKIRGRYQKYRSGERGGYYSFKGIRYGLPPIGARRFRAALPERPWLGIRDAMREGNTCPHKNMILDTFKGNEDCLFLNVFTSKIPKGDKNPKLPVMVWLHGGGFAFGSGNSFLYGPDFLVAQDIVLVTMNYRLGPLGFLSAGPEAPGNAGLKDQVLALKWVRENIESFGGNPNQVTIFGESAGGASVQFLILSPLAKGLFHRAISESGSALNPWAMAENTTERAFRMGEVLGFRGGNTEELVEFLRHIPARKLVEASPATLSSDDLRNNIGLPFVPCVEGDWNSSTNGKFYEEPFLTETPDILYKKGQFNNVPYIMGYNSHEAMLFIRKLRQNPLLLEIINDDFVRLVPPDLQTGGTNIEAENVSRKIREFYLGSRIVNKETIEEMIYLLTDLMFLRGIMKTARIHAMYGKMPTYLYRFAFDGSLGLYKRMLGITRPGVCHGDELGYLFQFGFFNLSLDKLSPEVLVKNRMVRMWTNFAKFGDPTPNNQSDPILTTHWQPVDRFNATNELTYMDITNRLELRQNPDSQRLSFWDNMYKHYNGDVM